MAHQIQEFTEYLVTQGHECVDVFCGLLPHLVGIDEAIGPLDFCLVDGRRQPAPKLLFARIVGAARASHGARHAIGVTAVCSLVKVHFGADFLSVPARPTLAPTNLNAEAEASKSDLGAG